MATIPWLADVLRAEGVQVVEEGDWRNRMRPGSFDPIGVLWHHTAATSSASNPHPALNICINGRPDLAGPLCQALVDYHGVFHVISAGRCNHAGQARASGPIPAGDGNTMLVGWEIDYNGVNQQMTPAQYNASLKATVAVLRRLGRDASYARGHRETSVTGKIDPSFIDLNVMRADVARLLNPPPGGWSSIVDNATAGRFTACANWGTSTFSGQRLRRRLPLRQPGGRKRSRLVQVRHPGDRHLPGRGLVAGQRRATTTSRPTSSSPPPATRPSTSTSAPTAAAGARWAPSRWPRATPTRSA